MSFVYIFYVSTMIEATNAGDCILYNSKRNKPCCWASVWVEVECTWDPLQKTQSYRTRISKEFKESKGLILVSSDVSARGVDYPNVTLVVQVNNLLYNFLVMFILQMIAVMGFSSCSLWYKWEIIKSLNKCAYYLPFWKFISMQLVAR